MRRNILRTTIAACAAIVLVPLSAGAESVDDSARQRLRDAAHDVEPIELDCAVRTTDARAAVHCEWSQPTWRMAHAVRLYRFDPATDPHRQVVFRTGELERTSFTDTQVRSGHGYAYAVVVVDEHGRSVGRSRTEWVRVPGDDGDRDVEVLRLECALGSAHEVIGCQWSRPRSRDAAVVSLWRTVDDGPRVLVETFRPTGPSGYRDPVPAGAAEVTYLVTASAESDRVVARSRPETVRIPVITDRPTVRPATTDVVRPAPTSTTTVPGPTDTVVRDTVVRDMVTDGVVDRVRPTTTTVHHRDRVEPSAEEDRAS
jgi:hypothetical protein